MAIGDLPVKGNLKSQVGFYTDLCEQLIRCDPLSVNQSKDLKRDLETLKSRVHHEGLSFLTKSLPLLGKALDVSLASLRFTVPSGFARSHRTGGTPAFMQGYFNLIFDSYGMLLENPSEEAIKHLRQVFYFAYKLEVPFSRQEEEAVIANFIETDETLNFPVDDKLSRILELASRITANVFKDFDPTDIIPRHGPGAVATGERLEDKWKFSRLYDNIHQSYPYYKYFVVGGAHELMDRKEWYDSLQRLETGVAKVILVPKDSRGPRLISCEPLEYQWVQQGLGRKLVDHLEGRKTLTGGNINFSHQEINRTLALVASRNGSYSTLDLKDASDRVSLELVRRIFKDSPRLLRYLEACRTTATTLPDGRVLPLNKFAPMGSALCFPIEAYIFWVVMVAAIVDSTRVPLRLAGKRIFVYGDDIVVPTRWASQCIQALESVDLIVNESKSCITGHFRESCGLDAFNGVDVTPLRLKKLWSDRPSDGSALHSYVSLANKLAKKGYKGASEYLWIRIESTYGRIPYGTFRSSFPCRIVDSPLLAMTLNGSFVRRRLNRNYQSVEWYVKTTQARRLPTKLEGWPRLLRDIVTPPFEDPSVVVLPRSTRIKRGWAVV